MLNKEKVYIAGSITSNMENYREEFAKAERVLEAEGYIVLNPAAMPNGLRPVDYMRIGLAMLEAADYICLLDNWDKSDGAKIEYTYAAYIGKGIHDIQSLTRPQPQKVTVKPKPQTTSRVERMFGNKAVWSTPAAPKEKPKPQAREESGYKGFLLLKCEDCGEIKAFCAKHPTTTFRCGGCGHEHHLHDLLPAHVNCTKCGKGYTYRTNIKAATIPFECFGCHSPVDLMLNKRETAYVTIGDEDRRH